MSQFGQELRRAREDQGVPLDAVSAVTKIAPRYLEALEAGRLEELPGGVFRKGIVRGYVSAVGLDEAEWMHRFDESHPASAGMDGDNHEWVEFAENVHRNRIAPVAPTGMRWVGVVLMVLTLLLCGWLTWKYVLRVRLPATVVAQPAHRAIAASGALAWRTPDDRVK